MGYGEPVDSILNFLSSVFGLPFQWFGFPQIIFFFIIPLVALIFLWVFLLNKLNIFKNSTVNFVLGTIVALVSTIFIRISTPPVIVALSVGSCLFLSGRLNLWRIIGTAALFAITFFLYTSILGSLSLTY